MRISVGDQFPNEASKQLTVNSPPEVPAARLLATDDGPTDNLDDRLAAGQWAGLARAAARRGPRPANSSECRFSTRDDG